MNQFIEDLRAAGLDAATVFVTTPIWSALGWNDVQRRYNRSKLGVIWASLSILIFVSALGPIYSTLFGVESSRFILHLMLGLIAWNYLQSMIMDSGHEFINSAHYMVSFQLGYFTLLLRVVWRNFIVVLYQLLMFFLMALVLNHTVSVNWLILPLSLLLITMCGLWMGLLMSVFATRFRDLIELVNNLLRLGFFVTPIMWVPDIKPELMQVANLNPFYHIVELLRGPLLSNHIMPVHWLVSVCVALAGWLIAFSLFAKYRSRIAFWV